MKWRGLLKLVWLFNILSECVSQIESKKKHEEIIPFICFYIWQPEEKTDVFWIHYAKNCDFQQSVENKTLDLKVTFYYYYTYTVACH